MLPGVVIFQSIEVDNSEGSTLMAKPYVTNYGAEQPLYEQYLKE